MAAVAQPSQLSPSSHSVAQSTPTEDTTLAKGATSSVKTISQEALDCGRRASMAPTQDFSTLNSAVQGPEAGEAHVTHGTESTSAAKVDQVTIAGAQATNGQPQAQEDSAPSISAAHVNVEVSSEPEGVPMPVVFEMDLEDAVTEDKDDSYAPTVHPSYGRAIQWVVLAHNSLRESSLDTYDYPAVASYKSSRPIKQTKPLYQRLDNNSGAGVATEAYDPAQWFGPAVQITYRVQAHMPWLKCKYPEQNELARSGCPCNSCIKAREDMKKGARIYNHDKIPASFNGHDIERWAEPALVLRSPHLYQELFELVDHYPGAMTTLYSKSVHADWEFEIGAPYGLLLHHYAKIEQRVAAGEAAAARDTTSDTRAAVTDSESVFQKDPALAREHLAYLHQYLKATHLQRLTECKTKLEGEKPKIAWDMLWYLLSPGQTVYVKDQWTPWYLAKINQVVRQKVKGSQSLYWVVSLWVMSSDGARIARYQPPALEVAQFDGFREVTSMDICPVDIWDRQYGPGRQLQALARGKLLLKAFREGHLLTEYMANDGSEELGQTGQVVVDHRRGQDMTGLRLHGIGLKAVEKDAYIKHDSIYVQTPWTRGHQHTHIAASARQVSHDRFGHDANADPFADSPFSAGPRQHRVPRKAMPLTAGEAADALPLDQASDTSPDREVSLDVDEDILKLLYPLTFGFSLKAKIWLELDATRLQEIKHTPDSEEFLKGVVLPNGTEKIFRAIVKRLETPDLAWSADFVKGKGSGGIILLHGPPGTGKTFTVERIAQELNRPLLALTVADLGVEETAIEAALLQWFAYAELWKAIMLIDEADIFLERRVARDLSRNGLVSAFLRRAEYFDGSLFLTTNRVGQIDDAFISRIQFAIHYQKLGGVQQEQIWKNFFQKLSKEQRALDRQRSERPEGQAGRPRISIDPDAEEWILRAFLEGKRYLAMNGRDIRNTLQTAITLAVCNEVEQPGRIIVVVENFQQVLKMGVEFREYIARTAKAPGEMRAFKRGDREPELKLDPQESKMHLLGKG